jgi:hypothetical protein
LEGSRSDYRLEARAKKLKTGFLFLRNKSKKKSAARELQESKVWVYVRRCSSGIQGCKNDLALAGGMPHLNRIQN